MSFNLESNVKVAQWGFSETIPPSNLRIVALILLPYNISIILKLKGHAKRSISRISIKKKKQLSSALNIIRLVGKVDKTVNKTANILIKSSILAIG